MWGGQPYPVRSTRDHVRHWQRLQRVGGWWVRGVLFTQVLREAALWSQEEPVEVVRAGTAKALGLVC